MRWTGKTTILRLLFGICLAVVCVNSLAEMPGFLRPVVKQESVPEAFWMPPGPVGARQLRGDAGLRAVGGWPSRPVAVAAGDGCTLLRSEDQGRTWTPVDPPASLVTAADVTLHDLIFTGPETVVAVGGGFEPVTAISRAVVLLSHDAGQSWSRGDDAGLPRLTAVQRSADGRALLATSDFDPVAGTEVWESINGGGHWMPTAETFVPPLSVDRGNARFGWPAVRRGEVAVAVGDLGVIERLAEDRWTAVRNDGATAATLFLARRATRLPWAILGQQSLCDDQRVSLACDAATWQPQTIGCGSRLGAGSIAAIDWNAGAIAEHIRRGRPASVVCDVDDLELIRAALQQFESGERPRLMVAQNSDSVQSTGGAALTLDHDAILVDLAVPAGDLVADAQLMLDPLTPPPAAVAIRSADEHPGPRRHLTESMVLPVQCRRSGSAAANASRHRLQLATARQTQRRLAGELIAGQSATRDDSLAALVRQTESAARLRWLWQLAWSQPRQGDTVMSLLAGGDAHPAVGRYAALRRQSLLSSRERRHVAEDWKRPEPGTPRPVVLSQWGRPGGGEASSPFQIAPVSYVQPQRATPQPDPVAGPPERPQWSDHPAVQHCRGIRSESNVQTAALTTIRPRLDGQVDDALWSAALKNGGPAGVVWIAGDREYLYVACRRPSGGFRVLIDTDDDPLSSFWLTIGVDGSVQTSVDGVLPWTPRVHHRVALDRGDSTLELAVRLDSLGLGPLTIGEPPEYAAAVACFGDREPIAALPRLADWTRFVLK